MSFGLAGYAAVKLSPESAAASLWWLLPASMAVASVYALFMGALSLRTRGVYFIMVTLAFAQMAYYLVHDTPLGGGTDWTFDRVLRTLPRLAERLTHLGAQLSGGEQQMLAIGRALMTNPTRA